MKKTPSSSVVAVIEEVLTLLHLRTSNNPVTRSNHAI